MIDMSVYSR